MPRTAPTREKMAEHLAAYARAFGFNPSTDAITFGDRSTTGFVDFVKTRERTTKPNARDWATVLTFTADPLYYLLKIRNGRARVIRMDDSGNNVERSVHVLGVCDSTTADFLMLSETGRFYSPSRDDNAEPTYGEKDGMPYVKAPPRRARDGQWIVTPEALRHMVEQAKAERAVAEAAEAAEAAAEQALVESRHGTALDLIRGLLRAAGLDPADHLSTLATDTSTVITLRLKNDEIEYVGDTLDTHKITPASLQTAEVTA